MPNAHKGASGEDGGRGGGGKLDKGIRAVPFGTGQLCLTILSFICAASFYGCCLLLLAEKSLVFDREVAGC